jgi:hypothetical protein
MQVTTATASLGAPWELPGYAPATADAWLLRSNWSIDDNGAPRLGWMNGGWVLFERKPA